MAVAAVLDSEAEQQGANNINMSLFDTFLVSKKGTGNFLLSTIKINETLL